MSSSSSGSRLDPIAQIENFSDRFEGIGGAIRSGVGGVIVVIFGGIALAIDAGRQLLTNPLEALAAGITDFFDVLVGGSADIIGQGVETTIMSVVPGAPWAIGPLTFVLTIGVWGIGLYVFAQIMEMRATSNIIPFSMTDLPIIGASEEDEVE